jgi:hypothetical protein
LDSQVHPIRTIEISLKSLGSLSLLVLFTKSLALPLLLPLLLLPVSLLLLLLPLPLLLLALSLLLLALLILLALLGSLILLILLFLARALVLLVLVSFLGETDRRWAGKPHGQYTCTDQEEPLVSHSRHSLSQFSIDFAICPSHGREKQHYATNVPSASGAGGKSGG